MNKDYNSTKKLSHEKERLFFFFFGETKKRDLNPNKMTSNVQMYRSNVQLQIKC